MSSETIWIAIGFLGQALFSSRFLVQWVVSERERRSVIPVAFWYFSLGGGLTLFSYALWRADPVFIAGQGMGIFIYTRNLILVKRERQRAAAEAARGGDGNGEHDQQTVADGQGAPQ